MAGQSSVMFVWIWTEVSVLGSQVFGQASIESWELEETPEQELFLPGAPDSVCGGPDGGAKVQWHGGVGDVVGGDKVGESDGLGDGDQGLGGLHGAATHRHRL